MSLRMRKQTFRKEIGSDKLWVPGPGNYSQSHGSDVGNDRRKLQKWKTPLRNPNWFLLKTDAPPGEKVHGKCLPRERMCPSLRVRRTWRLLTALYTTSSSSAALPCIIRPETGVEGISPAAGRRGRTSRADL